MKDSIGIINDSQFVLHLNHLGDVPARDQQAYSRRFPSYAEFVTVEGL
ncbi:hypothetical protein [Nocardia carnea]|nr:hypothetical protein [Nocardia carnea]